MLLFMQRIKKARSAIIHFVLASNDYEFHLPKERLSEGYYLYRKIKLEIFMSQKMAHKFTPGIKIQIL